MSAELASLVSRLETVTVKLEGITSSGGGTGTPAGEQLTASFVPLLTTRHLSPSRTDTSEIVTEFDSMVCTHTHAVISDV